MIDALQFLKRRPFGGKLTPRERANIEIEEPIRDDETPLILTPRPLQAVIVSYKPEHVTVLNKTNNVVPWLMFIIPKAIAESLKLPWKSAAALLAKTYAKPAVMEGVSRLWDTLLDRKKS